MPRTDRAAREIAAPADRVWAALVDPGALVRWLPPAGMTGRFDHVDLRPGGSYRVVLSYDDPAAAGGGKAGDGSDVVEGRYVELLPGVRLVQAADFASDDPALAGTMTVTWSLEPTSGGTRVEIRADGVPDGIPAADHAEGMASSLANLAAWVEDARAG